MNDQPTITIEGYPAPYWDNTGENHVGEITLERSGVDVIVCSINYLWAHADRVAPEGTWLRTLLDELHDMICDPEGVVQRCDGCYACPPWANPERGAGGWEFVPDEGTGNIFCWRFMQGFADDRTRYQEFVEALQEENVAVDVITEVLRIARQRDAA